MPDKTRSGKIMVVDDDDAVRHLLGIALRADGHEVLEIGDGREAFEQARMALPDVILLDWMMPGRAGIDILQELREDALTAHIPVVMVTAKNQDKDLSQSSRAGASAYIAKPFDVETVTLLVNRFLQNGSN